jgi:predicted MPP superfamily phosphohydrolase
MSVFALASLVAWVVVVAVAAIFRSRSYAAFRGVMLGVHSLIAVAILPLVSAAYAPLVWPFYYLHATVVLQSLTLVRPRMRSLAFRALLSMPSSFFQAGTLLALPWAIAAAFGWTMPFFWAPYLLAAVGLWQSLRPAPLEEVDVVVKNGHSRDERVRPHPRGSERRERPLRIVQITDPHLGAFMPVGRLRAVCERALERDPDLVLLTGDFLTMESQGDPQVLASALEPLRALAGRTFACMGNHDLEAPGTVRDALGKIGAQLLVDEAVDVETAAGNVQIVGMDFTWRRRRERLAEACARHPRKAEHLRIVLLHDPGAFRDLPEGQADLALSGHTHGGQLGLVSVGLDWTILRALSSSPDHGFWARGADRLYVHRGTGHYGFPIRLGVPAEESLLRVHW